MTTPSPAEEIARDRERAVDDFIAKRMAEWINHDLLAITENLLNHCLGRNDIPLYLLVEANDLIKKAKGERE